MPWNRRIGRWNERAWAIWSSALQLTSILAPIIHFTGGAMNGRSRRDAWSSITPAQSRTGASSTNALTLPDSGERCMNRATIEPPIESP